MPSLGIPLDVSTVMIAAIALALVFDLVVLPAVVGFLQLSAEEARVVACHEDAADQ
jgi:hypothetical protein